MSLLNVNFKIFITIGCPQVITTHSATSDSYDDTEQLGLMADP